MGGSVDGLVTVSAWQGMLSMPARRNQCLSAHEIQHRAAVLRRMLHALPGDQCQAVLDQLPPRQAASFLEMDAQVGAEAAQLTGNHPKRLALLAMAGDLPWMTHWDLLHRAAKAVGTSELTRPVDIEWHRDTPRAQRAAIQAEAATLVQVLAMLVLLSSHRHNYPGALLLELLWELAILSIAPGPVVPPAANAPPPRAVAPPGQVTIARPGVARAPGRGVSLVVGSEGRVGLGALWGSAVVA